MNDESRAEFERQSRSIPQLIRDFTHESTALVRDEVELAKNEVAEKLSDLESGITNQGAGALVLFGGFLVFLDAVVLWLMEVFSADHAWLSPLVVGVAVMIIGGMILANGRSKLKAHKLTPRRTVEQVRRDGQMLREKLS